MEGEGMRGNQKSSQKVLIKLLSNDLSLITQEEKELCNRLLLIPENLVSGGLRKAPETAAIHQFTTCHFIWGSLKSYFLAMQTLLFTNGL